MPKTSDSIVLGCFLKMLWSCKILKSGGYSLFTSQEPPKYIFLTLLVLRINLNLAPSLYNFHPFFTVFSLLLTLLHCFLLVKLYTRYTILCSCFPPLHLIDFLLLSLFHPEISFSIHIGNLKH